MKCPKCSRRIAFEATSHLACGWNVGNGDASVQNPYSPPTEPRTPEQRDPAGLRRVEEAIREVAITTGGHRDPHDWAKSIVRAHRAGQRPLPLALAYACEVLRLNPADL